MLFDRTPAGIVMIAPGDSGAWASYDAAKGTGSVAFSFSATDPDGDTLTYALLLGKDSANLAQVYQGRTGSYTALSLDTTSIYYWRLTSADPMQQTVTASGKFLTGRISPIPTDGLVAYYPFNGNANDESGNGNDGTVYGATLTVDRFGVNSKAYYFDGASSIGGLSTVLPGSTLARTICAWVRIDQSGGDQNKIIFMYGGSPYYWFHLYLSGTSPSIGFSTYGVALDTVNKMNDGKWHLLSGTFSDSLTISVDGIQIGNPSATQVPAVASSLSWIIGKDPWGGTKYKGSIDDIRIYNRALTDQEIQALYHENGWTGN